MFVGVHTSRSDVDGHSTINRCGLRIGESAHIAIATFDAFSVLFLLLRISVLIDVTSKM